MAFKAGTFLFLQTAKALSERYIGATDDNPFGTGEVSEVVQSTCIHNASYNKDTSVLRLTFTDGSSYKYYSVNEEFFLDLRVAYSKGQYFNRDIRDSGFDYERIG